VADGLLLSVMSSPAYVKFAMEHVRRGLAKSGRDARDFPVGAYILSSISEDERAARDPRAPLVAVSYLADGAAATTPIFAAAGLPVETIRAFGESFRAKSASGHGDDEMLDTFRSPAAPRDAARTCRTDRSRDDRTSVFRSTGRAAAAETMDDAHRHLIPYFT